MISHHLTLQKHPRVADDTYATNHEKEGELLTLWGFLLGLY